jgi:hypothetical protein
LKACPTKCSSSTTRAGALHCFGGSCGVLSSCGGWRSPHVTTGERVRSRRALLTVCCPPG